MFTIYYNLEKAIYLMFAYNFYNWQFSWKLSDWNCDRQYLKIQWSIICLESWYIKNRNNWCCNPKTWSTHLGIKLMNPTASIPYWNILIITSGGSCNWTPSGWSVLTSSVSTFHVNKIRWVIITRKVCINHY